MKIFSIFAPRFKRQPLAGKAWNRGKMEKDIVPKGEKKGLKAWLPVLGLTCAAFIFNTSEFVPIGLLSDIAGSFGISESQTGLMITIYAWVVALASLPLMLVFAKTENKKLMLSITSVFVVSHIFSAVAGDFYMLMISRVGVACAHAIFWSMVTPFAVRIAPVFRRDDSRPSSRADDRPAARMEGHIHGDSGPGCPDSVDDGRTSAENAE